jgi:hypothetical protein
MEVKSVSYANVNEEVVGSRITSSREERHIRAYSCDIENANNKYTRSKC